MSSSYVINIGREKPAEAIVAYPDKDGKPKEGEGVLRTYISVGKHFVQNVCSVWGRRVINGEANETPIEFNNPKYTGEIEFLKWGDPKGHSITIRYLKKSRSLDVEYQDNVQKITIDKEKGADGSAQIELNAGENKFDLKKDALFVKYLQVHSQNRDSNSKNPDPEIKGYSFYEVTDENVNTKSIQSKEDTLDAGYIVKKVSNKPADLKALLAIIGEREELNGVDFLSKDKQIYDALLDYAMTKPNDFMSLINDHKKTISDTFEKAKTYNALDLTKDGDIALIIENKKELLFTGLKGKGNNMLTVVLEDCFDSETHKKIESLISLVEKLK